MPQIEANYEIDAFDEYADVISGVGEQGGEPYQELWDAIADDERIQEALEPASRPC